MHKQCNRCAHLDIILDSRFNLIPCCSLASNKEAAVLAYNYNNSRFHKTPCENFKARSPDVMTAEDEAKAIVQNKKKPKARNMGDRLEQGT